MAESHQVLLVSFTDRQASRAAYQEALALPGLRQAVVVERSPEGLLDVPETHVEGAGRRLRAAAPLKACWALR
ncbi:hypothetical protein OG264_00235 [Streptomyces xanthophaeus]|uniref:hypothetical protein n=1 Tax=Streptomyces xanthophaeus TaxID=67385 RepID=UPI00386EC5BE|nr:hypothetical protein OG264_00235 [Streptomyces xanthophaeus]WST64952.1 hypothetical protein OG605_38125 [Streptomyces xanthophaeus]